MIFYLKDNQEINKIWNLHIFTPDAYHESLWMLTIENNKVLIAYAQIPGSGVVLDCIDSWSLLSF